MANPVVWHHFITWLTYVLFTVADTHGTHQYNKTKISMYEQDMPLLKDAHAQNEWSEWSVCSVTCSKGVRVRTLSCQPGEYCPEKRKEQTVCIEAKCDPDFERLLSVYCKGRDKTRHVPQECVQTLMENSDQLCRNGSPIQSRCIAFKKWLTDMQMKNILRDQDHQTADSVVKGQGQRNGKGDVVKGHGQLAGHERVSRPMKRKWKNKSICKDFLKRHRKRSENNVLKNEHCCGGILIDKMENICCKDVPHWQESIDIKCCGKTVYNSTVESCRKMNIALDDVALKPTHVKAQALSTDMIRVEWDPPEPIVRSHKKKPTTIVHGYMVNYAEMNETEEGKIIEDTAKTELTNKHSLTIDRLRPHTLYHVCVMGYKWEKTAKSKPKTVRTKRTPDDDEVSDLKPKQKHGKDNTPKDGENLLQMILLIESAFLVVVTVPVIIFVNRRKHKGKKKRYGEGSSTGELASIVSSSSGGNSHHKVEIVADNHPLYVKNVNVPYVPGIRSYTRSNISESVVATEHINQDNAMTTTDALRDLEKNHAPELLSIISNAKVDNTTLVQNFGKRLNTDDDNMISNLFKDTTTQTCPPKTTNECDSFGKPFQHTEVYSEGRASEGRQPYIQLEHSDVKITFSDKDIEGEGTKCLVSILSNIQAICQKLDLKEDVFPCSPAIECSLPDVTRLLAYAVIEIPCFGDGITVWRCISDGGENKLAEKYEIPRRDAIDETLDTFYILSTDGNKVFIYTKVFSWYICTYCKTGRDISLKAYVDIKADMPELGVSKYHVIINLYILEHPSVFQFKEYSLTFSRYPMEWINLPRVVSADKDHLIAKTHLGDRWEHITDPGDPDFETNEKIIEFSHVVPCVKNTTYEPYSCSWHVQNKDRTKPSKFSGFLYVGCNTQMNRRSRFVLERKLLSFDVQYIVQLLQHLNTNERNLLQEKLIGSLQIESNGIGEILSQLQEKLHEDVFAERIVTSLREIGHADIISQLNHLKIIPDDILKKEFSSKKKIIEDENKVKEISPSRGSSQAIDKTETQQATFPSQQKVPLQPEVQGQGYEVIYKRLNQQPRTGSLQTLNNTQVLTAANKSVSDYSLELTSKDKIRGELDYSPPSSFEERTEKSKNAMRPEGLPSVVGEVAKFDGSSSCEQSRDDEQMFLHHPTNDNSKYSQFVAVWPPNFPDA